MNAFTHPSGLRRLVVAVAPVVLWFVFVVVLG